MRLFFAVPVAENVRKTISGALRDSGFADPPWRWIPWENYHLTIKFLGEVDPSAVDSLCRAAGGAAGVVQPFRIRFANFGGLPDLNRPRVLYYDVEDGAGELRSLSGLIERAVGPLGFPPEQRPFKAHLTLARIKTPLDRGDRDKLKLVPPLEGETVSPVDHFQLVKSTLGRSGAVYEQIARFDLGI